MCIHSFIHKVKYSLLDSSVINCEISACKNEVIFSSVSYVCQQPSIAITPAPTPKPVPVMAATTAPPKSSPVKPLPLKAATLPNIPKQSKVTGSEAAAMWMKEAQNETMSGKPSAAVTAAAVSIENIFNTLHTLEIVRIHLI